ncbi:MAG: hypothetical protein JNK15_09950 [Planctomycetes bacterium]|nr:hypothetical protein [Planctomycetota bacterium]
MRTAVAFSFLFAATVHAQVQATATGSLGVSWQNWQGVNSQTAGPSGAHTNLTVPSVGSVDLTVGATTTLGLFADSPPIGFGYWSSVGGNVLLTYTAPAPVAGVLTLQMNAVCLMAPPFIDVNDDGTWEFVGTMGPATATIPVVLGPTPVRARINAGSVNFGGANCSYTASIAFTPNATNLQTVQPACGPMLAATLRRATLAPAANGELMLHVAGASGPLGVLFVGTTLSPGATCGPASNADVALLVTPNPAGMSIPISIPPAALGVFSLQYVDVALPFQLHWSNAVQATLP